MRIPILSLPLLLAMAPAACALDPGSGAPLFLPNGGQWPETAGFRAQAGPVTAWFTEGGWWLVAGVAGTEAQSALYPPAPLPPAGGGGVAVRLELDGARPGCMPEGLDALPGRCHFLLGNDPDRWVRGLPIHARLRYREVWPGIDALLRAEGRALAYDLELQAGASAESIRIRCDGIEGLHLEEGGALLLQTPLGRFRQRAPLAWQIGPDGRRRPVAACFRILDGRSYGFAVDGALPDLPLVIDPDLTWLTHLGGSGTDHLHGIDRDPNGLLAVAGFSGSWDLPSSPGVFQSALSGAGDAYVARLDPSRSGNAQLLWCTYLGGSGFDCAFAVSVHGPGLVTLAGSTDSRDFPAPRGFRTTPCGGWDGFVARLDPQGANLLFSTYLGGSGTDHAFAVHVDDALVTTVAGSTDSLDFPIQNAFQPRLRGGRDVFALRLDAQGLAVTWSTYLGGFGNECWYTANWTPWPSNIRTLGMDVDGAGRVLLGGLTTSPDFPVRNPYQANLNGTWEDAFAAILDPAQAPASQLVWSTFLGGSVPEGALAAAFGPGGVVSIGGYTYSSDFPVTQGAYCTRFVGTTAGPYNDGFVAWLDPGKTGPSQLVYSTFLGGTEYDGVFALHLDARGWATLGGYCSPNFPVTSGAFDTAFNGPPRTQDAWVARLRPESRGNSDLVHSTYLGGPGQDNLFALKPTGMGGVFVAGVTTSTGLPVTPGAFQQAFLGSASGFAGHLDLLPNNVARRGSATPHCLGLPLFEVESLLTRRPVAGLPIQFLMGNAPPSGVGVLFLGLAGPAPWLVGCGLELWTQPVFCFSLVSDPRGTATFQLPTNVQWASILFGAQPIWLPTAACTWGQLACSGAALEIQL